MWCLVKEKAEQFRQALKNGEIKPASLVEMATKERREFLAKVVGEENAKNVNTLFESKLLLKNQERGIISWARKVGKLDEKEIDRVLEKFRKLNRALNPQETEKILSDIVEKRLKIYPDEKQAKSFLTLRRKWKDSIKQIASLQAIGRIY